MTFGTGFLHRGSILHAGKSDLLDSWIETVSSNDDYMMPTAIHFLFVRYEL
jgi:hypothetical protein